jgi:hypothetical protein
MEPIYRQVKCIDRLPKESGFYQTNFGPRHFLVGCGRWMGCEPQFWFEAIELPSEKEIQEVMDNLEENDNNSANDEWLAGASFILNKLKGE